MRPSEIPQSYTTGTLAGAGTFYCESCGFTVALHERDQIPDCPHCHGGRFKRASMFGGTVAEPVGTHQVESPAWLPEVRAELEPHGYHVAWQEGERIRSISIEDEITRVGRSLAAEIRFDDPTVSRRHAILHRHDRGVRILDDRSLNGVFVNGERVHEHELRDGDEVVIGRFRLYFISFATRFMSASPGSGSRSSPA